MSIADYQMSLEAPPRGEPEPKNFVVKDCAWAPTFTLEQVLALWEKGLDCVSDALFLPGLDISAALAVADANFRAALASVRTAGGGK